VPVATLGSAEGVRVLGTGLADDAQVVRLELTFARAQAMFPFLWLDDPADPAGAGSTWRPFFPGDRVEVQLDAGAWVPRRITVYPASTERRRAWELRFGQPVEDPSVPILEVVATHVATEAPDASLFDIPGPTPAPTSVAEVAELVGYRPATPTLTGDLELATSIAPTAAPRAPTSLLVYADGLDYLRVGERPGSHTELVAPGATRVVLQGGGIAYYWAATTGHGRRIAILGDDTSLLLETNLPRLDLFAIADSKEAPRRWVTSRCAGGSVPPARRRRSSRGCPAGFLSGSTTTFERSPRRDRLRPSPRITPGSRAHGAPREPSSTAHARRTDCPSTRSPSTRPRSRSSSPGQTGVWWRRSGPARVCSARPRPLCADSVPAPCCGS